MRTLKLLFYFFLLLTSHLAFSAQINAKGWIVFVKSYQNERFCINFPTEPKFFNSFNDDSEDHFIAMAEKEGITYNLEVLSKNNDLKSLWQLFERDKKDPNIEIIDYSTSENKNNKILDITYFDYKKSIYCETRKVITQNNIYILSTLSNGQAKDDHSYFIHSFFIEG